MKKIYLLITITFLSGNLFSADVWDLLDKSMAAWNIDEGAANNKKWNLTQASQGKKPATVTVQDDYINITKTYTYHSYNYAFLTPTVLNLQQNTPYTIEIKARVNPIDKEIFPDIIPPLTSEAKEGGFEANQISARLNNRNLAVFLKYGEEGYITTAAELNPDKEDLFKLNTSEWHVYRFVFYADNLKFDVYIDDIEEPVFENVPTTSMTGINILRLGAESTHRCNMDIESVKMGTGDFLSKPKIASVTVSSDSHVANNERTISASAHTTLISNGEKLLLSLTDKEGTEVVSPVEVTVTEGSATGLLTIPASVPMGKYLVRASAPNGKIGELAIKPQTIPYIISGVSPLDSKMLPQVTPVSFTIEIEDYQYIGPSKEFIFPAIIDAKRFTTDGKFTNGQDTLARYYRYYTPHENPGGMYLATGPTLDGPWTERNTVIDLTWAKAVPDNVINKADHISACQVVWNDILNKFIMYFHGPNSTTHYATSDNLIDWEFGASILNSNQFSAKAQEASYAKVFEHEIPGLGNKYVLLLMIQENNMRKIYWAYSDNGIDWTPVKKPLLSPDLDYKKIPGTEVKPDYSGSFGNNIAGPYLFEKDGRYFVLCNGSSGHIFVMEVGESFDMEIHWGEYMKASDVIIDTDNKGNIVAVPRIAAPVFIQDDFGKWYVFFEAGGRLGANIAYAKEEGDPTSIITQERKHSSVSIYPTLLQRGAFFSLQSQETDNIQVEIFDIFGKNISGIEINGQTPQIQAPSTSGIYFVKVRKEEKLLGTFKIIVR